MVRVRGADRTAPCPASKALDVPYSGPPCGSESSHLGTGESALDQSRYAARSRHQSSPLRMGSMRRCMRRTRGLSLLIAAALLAGGCSDESGPTMASGTLQVIQAAESTATIDVMVDGNVVIHRLAAGAVSSAVPVPAGLREIF